MTFIKIKTIMYVDRDLGWQPVSEVFINTDKIVEIVPLDAGPYVIDLGGADYRYTITAAEWARIAPLLMPAPTEPVAPILPSRVFDAYNALNDVMIDAITETDYDKLYQAVDRLCAVLRPTIKAQHYGYNGYGEQGDMEELRPSPFPAALVSAYREYQRMLSLTGISQHRIDMQRAILIDLLEANMPLEETDHD